MTKILRVLVLLGVFGASCLLLLGQSVPTRLSLDDAIQRGIRANLGVAVREAGTGIARAERLRALSALLPTVSSAVSENVQRNNLAVFGFRVPGVPSLIGPFAYSDVRAFADVDLYNRASRLRLKAAGQNIRAEQFSVADARDLVVAAVANSYLTILASAARLEAARSEAATAEALAVRAKELHTAGVTPAIDELRARVQFKARQQQVLAAKNQLAKDKLTLARVIGLPSGGEFELTDTAPYAPLDQLSADELLARAKQQRSDYQSLKAQLEEIQLRRSAALALRYPTLNASGNYGANGVNQAQLHQTFVFTGALRMNLFDGGRLRAEIMRIDSTINEKKAQINDLEQQMDLDIRSSLLDMQSAQDQVSVAAENIALAQATLEQARDRFTAGVTDNIEVVQAQDALALAQEALITSRYGHNLAKVALARAAGTTETNLKQFMGAK